MKLTHLNPLMNDNLGLKKGRVYDGRVSGKKLCGSDKEVYTIVKKNTEYSKLVYITDDYLLVLPSLIKLRNKRKIMDVYALVPTDEMCGYPQTPRQYTKVINTIGEVDIIVVDEGILDGEDYEIDHLLNTIAKELNAALLIC